jgi:transposase
MEQGIGDEVRGVERAQGIAFLFHHQEHVACPEETRLSRLKDADSQGMQVVIRHLDRAYTNFFDKRGKHPQFKKKHGARQSIHYPQRVKLDGALDPCP